MPLPATFCFGIPEDHPESPCVIFKKLCYEARIKGHPQMVVHPGEVWRGWDDEEPETYAVQQGPQSWDAHGVGWGGGSHL